MSAWIVSQNHIRALVTGAVKFGVIAASEVEWYGALLEQENRASIDYRYNEKNAPERYTHEAVELDAVSLLKQVRCYDYQSCEHPAWEESTARKFCDKLEEAIRAILPAQISDSSIYSDAPWGV